MTNDSGACGRKQADPGRYGDPADQVTLHGKHAGKNFIRQAGTAVVEVAAQLMSPSLDAIHPANHRYRDEQERIEISHFGRGKPGARKRLAEAALCVSSPMIADLVLPSPEAGKSRDGDQQEAGRLDQTTGLPQAGGIIIQV